MLRKNRLCRGLTAVFAFVLIVAIVASNVALQNQALINLYLQTQAYEIVKSEDENGSTEYVKSSYGEKSEETMNQLIADTYEQVINEEEEGAVLLKNENAALPLDISSENRVTLFGRATADPLFTCSGSQSFLTSKTPEACTDLYEALTTAGFVINDTLYNAYKNSTTDRKLPEKGTGSFDIGEENISFYTDSLKDSWEDDYNDVAIVMLSRYAGEGFDIPTHATDDDGTEISGLALFERERDLLHMIKDSGKFSKTIVLLNSPYAMEVHWLDEYDVDACLWIGCTGATGFTGVANILIGETNPSGRLSDTYATSSLSSPAVVNSLDNTGSYTNIDEIQEYTQYVDTPGSYNGYTSFVVQLENIYFGYKYYETRYEDCILGKGNANSTVGSLDGKAWDYAKEMSYPFGFGLSYTTFSQTLDSVKYDKETDSYIVKVTVTNTGDVAGKSAVQLYAQTPYGDYEKENLVEKSAIQLIDFGKTAVLKPGESETIIIETDRYLLASYDDNLAKGYILSEGDYYLAIGDDVHDALNNILAAKGASGMYDQDGNKVSGDASKTWSFTNNKLDTESYRLSDSGVIVTNQFDDCDINYWDTTKVTYLTRQDWEGTYPTKLTDVECTEDMLKILNSEIYTTPEDAPSVDSFTQGVDKGLTFAMMKDVDYDDPLWEDYLDQFTLEEMAANATDNFGIPENVSVLKPATAIGDGTNGYRGSFSYGEEGQYSCQYASSGILAATFNKELMQNRAKLFAEESLFSGSAFEASEGAPISFGTNVGANLHRTPFGGRSGEYLSEDANLTAIAGAVMSKEMTSRNYAGGPKHFAGNDQETSRGGLSMFFTEQAFRESALRGFEGCLSWGGSMYTMQSMGRIGLYYIPASSALNTEVLRNEWGFTGFVMSDGALADFCHEFLSQITAGTDNMCLSCRLDFDETTGVSMPGHQYIEAIKNGDGYMLQCLRQMTKNVHYTLSRTMAVNGLSSDTKFVPITPWWKNAMYGADVTLAIITAALFVLTIVSETRSRKKV